MRIFALVVACLLAVTGCTGEPSDYTLTVTVRTSTHGPLDEPDIEPVEHVFKNVSRGQELDISGGIGPDQATVKRVTGRGIMLELPEPLTSSGDQLDRSAWIEEVNIPVGERIELDTPTLDTQSHYKFQLEG